MLPTYRQTSLSRLLWSALIVKCLLLETLITAYNIPINSLLFIWLPSYAMAGFALGNFLGFTFGNKSRLRTYLPIILFAVSLALLASTAVTEEARASLLLSCGLVILAAPSILEALARQSKSKNEHRSREREGWSLVPTSRSSIPLLIIGAASALFVEIKTGLLIASGTIFGGLVLPLFQEWRHLRLPAKRRQNVNEPRGI